MKPFDVKIHMSIEKRKAWGRKMLLLFGGLVLFLLLCSTLMFFGCVRWDEQQQALVPDPKVWWQYLLLSLGGILAPGSVIAFTIYSYFEIKRFYVSQLAYQATPEYAKQKEKARKHNLEKMNPKDLKWYKKMGYITSAELANIKEKQKEEKKK